MKDNVLILGCGYTGTFFLDKYKDSDWTSRTPAQSKPTNQLENSKSQLREPICFNLVDKETWNNISDSKNVLWAFAINDFEQEKLALEFFDSHLKDRNVIILSSTGAYNVEKENEEVDETYPLKLDKARYSAEEKLREKGAMALHLSGIVGPDRYPKKWYDNGWVKNGQNVLNYIDVSDIVFLINELFKKFKAGERFNLTSADWKTHQTISDLLKIEGEFVNKEGTVDSKKVKNTKILDYLNLKDYKFVKYPEDCIVK